MTQKETRDRIRSVGLTCRIRNGEYRVNYVGGAEATAYYTDNDTDAYDTAVAMAETAGYIQDDDAYTSRRRSAR